MSTELHPIKASGERNGISVTQFKGDGMCVQLTQGVSFNAHDPGFIQLTKAQAEETVKRLQEWLDGKAEPWHDEE